jgi:hypothetical protein
MATNRPTAILKLRDEKKSRPIAFIKGIDALPVSQAGEPGWYKIQLENGTTITLSPAACQSFSQQVTTAVRMESFAEGFRTAERLQPKVCASCGGKLHAVDGNGNLCCDNGHVTLTEGFTKALFKPLAIKMQDEPNVPGAWMCEHMDIGPGSLQPGKVVFCPTCAAKYEQGAALVHEDGYVLKPTGKGRWVKGGSKDKRVIARKTMKAKCDWKCPACGADFGTGYVCTNGHHIVSRGRYAGRKLLDRTPKAKFRAAGAGK